jgi:predicted DNA-binding transcriptional regulator YafY
VRADRLISILLILQRDGRVTAGRIAAELEVSERTVRRDLDALSRAGQPVYSESGRHGGWRLAGRGKTDLSGLTLDEARALFLAVGSASSAMSLDVASAASKLLRALPEPFRGDAELAAKSILVDPTWWWGRRPEPVAEPEHLDVLRRAVLERRRVLLGYVDRQRTATERTVDPLGLVSKGATWYLIAGTDRGTRTFRVARVRSATITDVAVERPVGFDLAAEWERVVAGFDGLRPQVHATIRLDARALPGLRAQFGADMALAETERPAPDGRETVIVAGPSARVIAQHLAGWGSHIDVVEPDDVRTELVRIGHELVDAHAAPA